MITNCLFIGCGDRPEENYSNLVEAIIDGDTQRVDRLVKSPSSFEPVGPDYIHPLLIAAMNDQTEIAELLLKRGADIDVTFPPHFLELTLSQAEKGSEGALSWIRQNGASSVEEFRANELLMDSHRTTYLATALFTAAERGNVDMVGLLLRHHANPNIQATGGWTPLHCAASSGHSAVVELLLAFHANPNALDNSGTSALAYAGMGRRYPAYRVLLDAGADPYLRGGDSVSAVYFAATGGDIQILQLLKERGFEFNRPESMEFIPLHGAAQANRPEVITFLLENGADVNTRASDEITPLHLAAIGGGLDAAKVLVAAGADPALRTSWGSTPQDVAIENDQTELAEYLNSVTHK